VVAAIAVLSAALLTPEFCDYARLSDPAFKPIGESLWAPVEARETARVFRRRDTGETVVAFTGGPSAPIQFDRAREYVSALMKASGGTATVTGRGAAGGVAHYVAYSKGLKAVLFDPVMLGRAELDALMGCGRGGDCRGDDVRITTHALPDLASTQCLARAPRAPAAPKASSSSRGAELEWVAIPGGGFTMGSARGDEGPPHRVAVKAFRMAKSAVTNRQYRACVDAGACTPADDCENRSLDDDHPVVCVDWEQSRTFARWAGGRLPTEAEWEYAARSAGKARTYPWGDQEPDCDKAAIAGCGAGTAPVCSKPAGNTDQGLCDMAGNTWAWVQDAYRESYKGAPDARYRVFRGGSFLFDASYARATQRRYDVPETRCGRVGFRPVKDL